MDEDLTPEQQAQQQRLLQSMLSELETKIAPIKELDELSKRCDGMFRVGARVETRKDTSGDWGRWSEPSSVGEVVLVRCVPPEQRSPLPKAWATYDVRYDDGRVAEAVPLERVRRYPGTPCYAPNGKDYCSPLESPHNLIIQASNVGDAATVAKCLDAGVKIEHAMNGCFESILFIASGRGHTDLVRMLVERGAAVDEPHQGSAQGKRDWTPLHHALFFGYHAAARVLIEHGARVDAMLMITVHAPGGDHRLHVSERDCHLSIVSPLFFACRAAADEDIEDYDVEYPYNEFFVESDDDDSAVDEAFDGAACVRLLLEHVDVDAKVGDYGWTQLHVACLAGRVGVAKVLLAHGADPFCADTTGMTPLDAARGLRTDRSAWLDWFDIDKYKRGPDGMPLPGQARRERAALNVMFDRYLTARWKQTVDLTFARLPDHATGDEYLARHLGSFLTGDILPRKEEDVPDAGDASSVASDDSSRWDESDSDSS